MREYVEYGGLGSAPGPLACKGTTLHCFWLPASYRRLHALCRRVFDEPSGGAVRADPLLPFVLLSFGEVASIAAGPPYDRRGRVTERQVGVWVPTLVRRKSGAPKREVGFFLPWMWLDNPVSIASGREVYGYPKTWGWATFAGERHRRGIFEFGGDGRPYERHRPERTRDSAAFELDSFALREHDPKTLLRREPLLRVAPVGGREGGGEAEVAAAPESAAALASRTTEELGAVSETGDGLGELDAAIRATVGGGGGVKQFFLRQFRSPVDGGQASYQDIVRAEAVVSATPKPRSAKLGKHRIEIDPVASDPLAETLGVKSGPTYAAVSVSFDFEIGPGEILWSSAD